MNKLKLTKRSVQSGGRVEEARGFITNKYKVFFVKAYTKDVNGR
jgi:hypothetical protein